MSINYPYSENTLKKLIKNLNENEMKEVIDFIEFIKKKDKKLKKLQNLQGKRRSLRGILSETNITDEDIEEAKKIWK